MKKIIIPLVLIATLVLLLGCSQPPAVPADETSGLKDCGTNADCIGTAAKTCEKAFATITQASESPKSSISIKIIIFGFQENKSCKVKYKMEKIEVDPASQDATAGQIMAAMLQGKDMTCFVPEEQLAGSESGLVGIQTADLKKQCTGSLADTLSGLMSTRS